jgi:hypothetical protein
VRRHEECEGKTVGVYRRREKGAVAGERERLLELELEHWPHMERGMTGDREDGWNSQEK